MELIAICFDYNVNPDKFPSGYVFELNNSEKEYVVKNFDHLETLKFSHATVRDQAMGTQGPSYGH